jgi:nicotinate phosphoribosyltransferase
MVNPEFDIRRPILVGDTADVYLQRTLHILRSEGINPVVTMEFAPARDGLFCGIAEVRALLTRILPETGSEVWALEEGASVEAKEVALRVKAPYGALGLYETAIAGTLSSSTGWATAARACVDAANGTPVFAVGARRMHPNVAAHMDYASVIGGCVSCSTTLGARLAGVTPTGSMPHALALILGDTVRALQAFDRHTPQDVPRVALVDTHRDEAEEAIAVSKTLRDRLRGIRVDTAAERGGVTPELVKEIRARLDLAGFKHVEITVTGGLNPERIRQFVDTGAPVQSFGVGTFIASAMTNGYTADIHEVDGRPIAKRGRTPGITPNPRLDRIM